MKLGKCHFCKRKGITRRLTIIVPALKSVTAKNRDYACLKCCIDFKNMLQCQLHPLEKALKFVYNLINKYGKSKVSKG